MKREPAPGATSGLLAASFLAMVVAVTIAWPGAFVVAHLAGAVAHEPREALHAAVPDPGLLARTAGVAALISALATVLAWPGAWTAQRLPARLVALLTLPLLLPSYLISSGWGLL